MRWRSKVFIFIAVGVVVASLLVAWWIREPRYEGRSLTSWLEQCTPVAQLEAFDAVRAIGAERALPHLMSMIRAHDGPMRSWMIERTEKWEMLKIKSAEETRELGAEGFYVLGTNAAAAVPELTRMLDDTNYAYAAVQCLTCIGEPARESLCRALTNRNWQVRECSLAYLIDDPKADLAQIKGCLNDAAGEVRYVAVSGIGMRTNNPDLAIPILITALKDTDDRVSARAAVFLANFGTNGLRAFGALTNAMGSGAPKTVRAALGTLIQIAPKEMLPTVLERLHSDDVKTRRQALLWLWKYPIKAPEIQAAIEGAASDSDSVISSQAKEFVTEYQRDLRGNQPLFPDEPSYGGKPLGEWLKEGKTWWDDENHRQAYRFRKGAEDAIRHMGTNAIPALLKRLTYVRPPYGLPAYDINTEATCALMFLGDAGRPALPELVKIMEGENEGAVHAINCIFAICGMKSDAIPYLLKALSSQHVAVRMQAIAFLGQGVDAEFKIQRKQAVPFLVKLLDDKDEVVSAWAGNALKEIDPETAKKAGR
jgi:HEAT repeat protein